MSCSSKNVLCPLGFIALVAVADASNPTAKSKSMYSKFYETSQTHLGDAAGIMKRWNDFNNNELPSDLRGRRDTCNEDEYFSSIDISGVDENAFQNYMKECDSFISEFENLFLNGSSCDNKCLQPSLNFFRLAASGTGGGNCTQLKLGLQFATTLFEDIACPKNENGVRCGVVLAQIDGEPINLADCNTANAIGCCYNKIISVLQDPKIKELGISIPEDETLSQSEQEVIRQTCGSGYPHVFSASCASATPGNGIAESDINSGIPDTSASDHAIPSLATVCMMLVFSLTLSMV